MDTRMSWFKGLINTRMQDDITVDTSLDSSRIQRTENSPQL